MNEQEALAFLHGADWRGSQLGLSRIRELMGLLGDPQRDLRFVHVAGTNGKGSISAMLSAILTAAEYRTGLYTSPHLLRYNERIQVNGEEISDRDFCLAAEAVSACAEHMADPPTEFERLTAMALWHFQQVRCRIVVLEVGLGGRMDATNVIDAPEAAVITQLGLEHTRELGGTLRRIAGEKSGILKPGCAAVLCRQEPEAEQVVRETCGRLGVPLVVTEEVRLAGGGWDGQVLDYRERRVIRLGLLGGYQRRNAAAALDTVDVLNARGFCIPEQAVRRGLAGVSWPGRFSLLRRDPWVIVDGAHNPNGAAELADSLRQYFPGQKITFVIGVMADKDCANILRAAVPLARVFFTVTPASPRAMNSGALAELIRGRFRVMAVDAETVSQGIRLALGAAGQGPVCVMGALYQVGEAYNCLHTRLFPQAQKN